MWLDPASARRRLTLRRRTSRGSHAEVSRRLIGVPEVHGAQAAVRRVIAVVTAAFGVNVLIMMASPAGPQGRAGRILALAAAAGCLLMATWWRHRGWPSHAKSVGFVLVGAACTAVTTVVPTDPDAGLLTMAAASALLTGYTTCFHGGRLLLVTWVVLAAAIGETSLRVAAVDPVLAILGATTIGAINVVAVIGSRAAMRLLPQGGGHDEVDRLTGLLTEATFRARIANLLAADWVGPDRYLVLMVLDIDGYSVVTGTAGRLGGLRAQTAVGSALRAGVHRDALMAHRSDAEFLVADVLPDPDATLLVENLRTAVACSTSRLTVSAGVVCTPLSPLRRSACGEVLEEIVTLATAAMTDARRSGGNTARYLLNPRLATVVGFDPDMR